MRGRKRVRHDDGGVKKAAFVFAHTVFSLCVLFFFPVFSLRVALAAALFVAPDLLLLDEPTNHLVSAVSYSIGTLCMHSAVINALAHSLGVLYCTTYIAECCLYCVLSGLCEL